MDNTTLLNNVDVNPASATRFSQFIALTNALQCEFAATSIL
ncbi:hypothetical protein [Mariprofundus micogutta]|nr:hypothetical protein [Mariprofundus micogutta]